MTRPRSCGLQVCGLKPSILRQQRSTTEEIRLGLGLVRCGPSLTGLVLCCETRSCYDRRHNELEGQRNFSCTIYRFCILCSEHNYCVNPQWRSASYRCGLGLGRKKLVLFT